MAFNNGPFPPRQKIDVSAMGLKCAECATPITELPFQPSADRPVFCFDCNKKRKAAFTGPRNRY
ncbi:MAG: CxxC-x17-CxxC domain-containing protein [Patescibacteria group bacterium]